MLFLAPVTCRNIGMSPTWCFAFFFFFLKKEELYLIMRMLQTPLKIICSWQAVSLVFFPGPGEEALKFKSDHLSTFESKDKKLCQLI